MHVQHSAAARSAAARSAATRSAATRSASATKRRRGRVPVPPVPLGSLTQREHQHSEVCRGCGSSRVTRLSLNLTDGTPVDFTSCHRCEHRTWRNGDGELSMETVLDRTRRS